MTAYKIIDHVYDVVVVGAGGSGLRAPAGAVPMALFVLAAFKHSLDGMTVIVDDYVHAEGNRLATHFVLNMAAIAGAALSLFALARIAFGAPIA